MMTKCHVCGTMKLSTQIEGVDIQLNLHELEGSPHARPKVLCADSQRREWQFKGHGQHIKASTFQERIIYLKPLTCA